MKRIPRTHTLTATAVAPGSVACVALALLPIPAEIAEAVQGARTYPFHPLHLDTSDSPCFSVLAMFIGAEQIDNGRFDDAVAEIGQCIAVYVRNTSTEPQDYRASLVGEDIVPAEDDK